LWIPCLGDLNRKIESAENKSQSPNWNRVCCSYSSNGRNSLIITRSIKFCHIQQPYAIIKRSLQSRIYACERRKVFLIDFFLCSLFSFYYYYHYSIKPFLFNHSTSWSSPSGSLVYSPESKPSSYGECTALDYPSINPSSLPFEHNFTEAGEYPHFCLFHPTMVGSVGVSWVLSFFSFFLLPPSSSSSFYRTSLTII